MQHAAVELLSHYLQIDTTNPPGNEDKGVDFFAAIFEKEGIDCKVYEASPRRRSIKAVIPGTGEKGALVLLNHIDVVPARAEEWSVDPFSGVIKDGFIYGRGALDMKSLGILELLAFLEIKKRGHKSCRDIMFLAVADEETGGGKGVQYLLDAHPDEFQADLVLNEGGFGIDNMFPNRPVFTLATAEKGICQVKLVRTGPPGHGSTPHGDNALEKMVRALNRLLTEENPFVVTPLIAEYFKQLGTEWKFLKPFLKDGKEETLIEVLTRSGMIKVPQISAMLKNTISLNQMHAGDKINVIPSSAEAEFDIRLLPGTDPDAVIADIKNMLAGENIRVETVKKASASESTMATEEFAIIKKVVLEHFPDALTVASLLVGASDSRFFRNKGIPCYGVWPMLISLEELNRVHGIDERISIENMIRGAEVFTDIVKRLCNIE
jgi:acetylornithine deacetylase/succinyl-diaminopimelate desuccinylase-like protein